ncbi:MAG: molybdate ABC transporter permease subunit [Cytophagales bacterium]|nr:molybdate ABC transporter permease subunit [Cytophagales bacterium]
MEAFNFTYEEFQAIALSLKVAAICSLISLPIAIGVGWLLARKKFPGKWFVDGFVQLPLVLPPVTTGYLLLITFGNRGFVGKFLSDHFQIQISFTFWAAILASTVVSFPLVVRAIKVAVEMVDRELELAARTLGAGPWKVFFTITIPLAMPGILSGLILCFARCLGEFGATITFAGNIVGQTQTLPLAIYAAMEVPGGEMIAFRLAAFSVALSFMAMVGSEFINRKLIMKT